MDNIKIKNDLNQVVQELIKMGNLSNDKIVVLGGSTSEVVGEKIGTSGSLDVAKVIYEAIKNELAKNKIHLTIQCCEHLNRAVVIEEEVAQKLNLEIVKAIPTIHAGGALATYAYSQMNNPCLVEYIKADAGIDIGNTLIGMHLKHVAVPLRIKDIAFIGKAPLVLAYTRPKYIGGARTSY